ncbi:hypothetical protein [Streptomyces formicae]|uniref:DUF7847 domain-containing protein n=1 Tax=Streptomyces formicae TaxID=1616117 RepID=A0ABY3WUA3_9ACTN|nr:hypothetical protein [Streptomyces formicae]UNM14382.1 hypothetical protein J4032_25525 [Streptomyces formicae]
MPGPGPGPYGSPYPGPYGSPYGGAPGWGGWGPPPPPKPGVVPLQPLTVGDLLNGAVSTIGRYKKPVIGISAAVFGACALVVALALLIAFSAVSDTVYELIELPYGRDPEWEQIQPLVVAFVCVWVVAVAAYLLAMGIVQASMLAVLQQAVLGRPAGFGSVWRQALPRVPALIGTGLLSGLIAMVPAVLAMTGFVVALIGASLLGTGEDDAGTAGALIAFGFIGALVTVVPAVWLWVKFSLAPAAVVFEKQGPIAAMRRSSALVRGRWWPVFGISLLAYLIAAVIAWVIQQVLTTMALIPTMAGAPDLGPEPELSELLSVFAVYIVVAFVAQLIAYVIQTTFPPLVNGLLYVDQRIRKENLAPVLAEAAGMTAAAQPPVPPVPPGPPFTP